MKVSKWVKHLTHLRHLFSNAHSHRPHIHFPTFHLTSHHPTPSSPLQVVILAREAGAPASLQEVAIESLVPAPLRDKSKARGVVWGWGYGDRGMHVWGPVSHSQ